MTIICALAAILIWSSLASLSVSLAGIPPLMLIGCSLLIGGSLSVPWRRNWNLNWKTILVGCYGMLLYHLLFILALRNAPPVNANIVHYSWPMLIVLLSPIILKKYRLRTSSLDLRPNRVRRRGACYCERTYCRFFSIGMGLSFCLCRCIGVVYLFTSIETNGELVHS